MRSVWPSTATMPTFPVCKLTSLGKTSRLSQSVPVELFAISYHLRHHTFHNCWCSCSTRRQSCFQTYSTSPQVETSSPKPDPASTIIDFEKTVRTTVGDYAHAVSQWQPSRGAWSTCGLLRPDIRNRIIQSHSAPPPLAVMALLGTPAWVASLRCSSVKRTLRPQQANILLVKSLHY